MFSGRGKYFENTETKWPIYNIVKLINTAIDPLHIFTRQISKKEKQKKSKNTKRNMTLKIILPVHRHKNVMRCFRIGLLVRTSNDFNDVILNYARRQGNFNVN